MGKHHLLGIGTLLLMLAVVGCGGTAAPASSAAPASVAAKPSLASSPASAAASAAAKPAAGASAAAKPSAPPAASGNFQAQWDALVAAAKSEGKLTIGESGDPPLKNIVFPAFAKQFGIQAEELAVGSGTQLANKLIQEKAGGVHSADLVLLSPTSSATLMYPAGMYATLKPSIIIPDAGDSSKWVGGKIPYLDPDGTTLIRLPRQMRYLISVSPDLDVSSIKSPQDLLDPKWKGKMASVDTGGSGGQLVASIILKLMGEDFVRKLYNDQQVKYTPEQRVLGDWIAHSTYPIGIALPSDERANMRSSGLKVNTLKGIDPITADISGGSLVMGLLDQAPHPNAAKLFANWILTKEGMQILADAEGQGMIRSDIDYSKFNPDEVPPADSSKYYDDANWEYATVEAGQLAAKLKTIIIK
jgi:iron(III) transport system substrate-binding protein